MRACDDVRSGRGRRESPGRSESAPTSPSRAASRRRRVNSARVDTSENSFLGSSITQECALTSHDKQRPSIARVAANRSASPSAEKPVPPRRLDPVGPRPGHRHLPVRTPGTDEHRVPGPPFDVENLEPLPPQRMERMSAGGETPIITGRCGSMPPPSGPLSIDAMRCEPASPRLPGSFVRASRRGVRPLPRAATPAGSPRNRRRISKQRCQVPIFSSMWSRTRPCSFCGLNKMTSAS